MQSKDKIMEKEKMQQYADKLRQFVMGHIRRCIEKPTEFYPVSFH